MVSVNTACFHTIHKVDTYVGTYNVSCTMYHFIKQFSLDEHTICVSVCELFPGPGPLPPHQETRLDLRAPVEVRKYQTWALALFFQIRSPLILIPWIAIALSLILPIFRFAHRSIALKKTWFALGKER